MRTVSQAGKNYVPPGRRVRSFVVVQIPVLDLRSLVPAAPSRLSRPDWPDPLPGVEFVRSIGGVRARPLGPIHGWDGEMAYCDANRLLRFIDDPGTGRESLSVQYRRLYGFEYGYRLDIAFVARSVPGIPWSAVADRALQLCVRVGVPDAAMLQGIGPTLAHRLELVTGSKKPSSDSPARLVSGTPAVLIEAPDPAVHRIAITGRVTGPMAPCYHLSGTPADLRRQRRLRGALWRLHTELQFLRLLNRHVRLDKTSFDAAAVCDLAGSLTRHLAQNRKEGVSQPPLVALASAFGSLELDELLALADVLRDHSLGIARQLELAVERAGKAKALAEAAREGLTIEKLSVKGDVVSGNKIKASGGAVVNVDSIIMNSFNRLEERDVELKDALVDLMALVGDLDTPAVRAEAIELAEAMVDAAESDKRGVFRASWERLKVIAPVVGSAASITSVIARFLGVA